MIYRVVNFEAIYAIVYSDELFTLLYRISYKKKVNEYSNILGRNSCAFYVKKPVIPKIYFKKYVLP